MPSVLALANSSGKKKDRRWDADFLTLSNLIRNGTLGRIVELRPILIAIVHRDRLQDGRQGYDLAEKQSTILGPIF